MGCLNVQGWNFVVFKYGVTLPDTWRAKDDIPACIKSDGAPRPAERGVPAAVRGAAARCTNDRRRYALATECRNDRRQGE